MSDFVIQSNFRYRLTEMDSKYAGNIITEAGNKSMPPSLMWGIASNQPMLSNETLQIYVAQDSR